MNKTVKKIIYIADDDRAIVEALSFMLEDAGYDIETAYDDAVVCMVHEKEPDLLLLDIWMSGVDGSDICRKLKNDLVTKNVPIIMVSANPDIRVISKACGANDYIAKPFDVNKLLGKIALLLEPDPMPAAG